MKALRILGILLIAGGVGGAIIWPNMAKRVTGEEVARAIAFDRDAAGWHRGWKTEKVELSTASNPMTILIEAEFLPAARKSRNKADVHLVLARGGEITMEGTFGLTLPLNSGTGSRWMSVATPEFSIAESGEHVITVRPVGGDDPDFATVRAIVKTDVLKPDARYLGYGYTAIAGGIAAVFLSFARGGAKKKTARPKARRKSRNWGRPKR